MDKYVVTSPERKRPFGRQMHRWEINAVLREIFNE